MKLTWYHALGLRSYFLKINSYSDLEFSEFSRLAGGIGQFQKTNRQEPTPSSENQGELPVADNPNFSIDYRQGVCQSKVTRVVHGEDSYSFQLLSNYIIPLMNQGFE